MASNEDVDAILSSDPGARLDAIVRRHGGTPHKLETSSEPRFRPLGRFKIEQDPLFPEEGA